ncbi:MAG TPA: GNVR domain-containing protein, partial [Acetobacteraceae bacterium]|nr:GNVR domain-containing protein [Acetobacteraceae bacterium]
IMQKKLISQLKASPEKANQPVTPSTTPADVKRSVPNPIYDSLKVRLVDSDSQVTSLQRQLDEAISVRDRLEKFQREQPGLLAEFQNMDRDYGVLRGNYEALLGRLQSANIAQAADTQADKVKLQIVDPPEIPRIAVAPNRVLMLSGVLFAGMAAGAVIVLLLSQMDRCFNTVDDLRDLGLPVLGGISIVRTRSIIRRLMVFMRFATAVGVLVVIYGGLVLHVLRSSA